MREVVDFQQLPVIFPLVEHGQACPIKEPETFGPVTHREALPILILKQEGFHLADFNPSASKRRLGKPYSDQ